jgi:hypothetical protein
MFTVREVCQSFIKESDLLLLPEFSLERAIEMALERYSSDFPRQCIIDVNSNAGVLNMPPDWVRGWSKIQDIEYPIEGLVVPDSQDSLITSNAMYLSSVGEPLFNGAVVRLSNSFLYLASATIERFDAVGVVIQADLTHAIYTTDGTVKLDNWLDVAGSEFLSVGSDYFLQIENGKIAPSPPLDAPIVKIGRAMSETELDVEINIVL